MMAPSHLLATVLAGLVLARYLPWDARSWWLAIGFGVLIDLDHLLQAPRYLVEALPTHGLAALSPAALLQYGAAWQGFLHTPLAGGAFVLAACLLFRSPIPAVFWGLHMVLDFVVARRYVVFGSPTEFAIMGAMAVAVALLAWAHHRTFGAGTGFGAWAQASVASFLAVRR